jgi:hypothetical protein
MSVATANPASVAGLVPLAADLFLVRLLPAVKRPPSPKKVGDDLAKFFRHPPAPEQWQELAERLRVQGLIEAKSPRLTEVGRARALDFLGVNELPRRVNWKTVKARYLLLKVLGLAPTAPDAAKRVQDKDRLAALLLRRRFRLPVGTGSSFTEVLTALACRELGFPDATSMRDLKARALNRLLGATEPLDDEQLAKQIPLVLLGAPRRGMDGLRDTILCGWADGPKETGEATPLTVSSEFDIQTFANTVKAAARDCPTGRFGDNKVFISHVWRQLCDEPGFPRLDLAAFKQKLVEANTRNLLTLSRADLVQIMNPTDVSESETHYLNAVFHFVLLDREQP